jgi:hypothetical protein
LSSIGAARSDQARRQLADAGLVADERDARLARVLLEIGDERRERAARRERLAVDDRRMSFEPRRQDSRRSAARARAARQDDVERDAQALQPARRFLHGGDAVGRQRPLVSSGHLSPRSSATPWRTRYSS